MRTCRSGIVKRLVLVGMALIVGMGTAFFEASPPALHAVERVVALSVSSKTTRPQVPSSVRVNRKSDTSLKVRWSKVPGAKSYRVYRLVKGKWKVVKTTSSLSWVNKKLPKRKVQQYRVAACAKAKGKAPCGSKSVKVSATTYAAKDKKVNVRAVRLVGFPRDELGVRDGWEFGVELTPTLWGEMGRQVPVSVSLRMVSSDPSVVTVKSVGANPYDGAGRLLAKKVGSAVITVTAHNGVSKSVRLYVRDRACPVVLHDPMEGWTSPGMTAFIKVHGDKVCALTRYVLSHPVGYGYIFALDQHGQLERNDVYPLPDDMWGQVRDVLSTGSPYPVELFLSDDGVSVYLYTKDIPWGEDGSRREILEYRPYWYNHGGNPDTTHWSTGAEQGGEISSDGAFRR
jgi:hypothetical protein